ncbi:MAG: DUF4347 domain-containing protein, partial [Gammaproteobacteria bacterium]|nr:DUF4347 domain-containing protein [Gammaproteobacteria bacterium]
MPDRPHSHTKPILEEIEPRLLFSADWNAVFVPDEQIVEQLVEEQSPARNDSEIEEITRAPTELVFIDSRVPDYEQLLADLEGSTGERNFTVVVLDPAKDGITQISEELAKHEDVAAIHLISHGTDDQLQLGDTWLDADNVSEFEASISLWQN